MHYIFTSMLWVGLQSLIVAFPVHTHLLFELSIYQIIRIGFELSRVDFIRTVMLGVLIYVMPVVILGAVFRFFISVQISRQQVFVLIH